MHISYFYLEAIRHKTFGFKQDANSWANVVCDAPLNPNLLPSWDSLALYTT